MSDTTDMPTLAEWSRMTPMEQGFCSYMYSHLPDSCIPEEWECPYPQDSEKRRQFDEGVQRGVLCAQDSES